MKRILGNMSTRIMLIIFVIIILMSGFFIVFGYYNQLSLHEQKQYDRLKAIVNTVAISMDGDAHERMFFENTEKDGIKSVNENADYKSINSLLQSAVEKNELGTPMYTLVYDKEEDIFRYGVRSDDQVYFRHEYVQFPDVLIDEYQNGGIIPQYSSENGVWLSAFHPITNSKKEVVGLVEADVEFGYFIDMVRSQYMRQAMIALAVIIAIALILIPYVRLILKRDQEQKELFLMQKRLIEEKNKDITDSINYAQQIQHSILPASENFKSNFADSFVYYRSKDIVAGDFYWMEKLGNDIYLACADCTGHGVPGAMVSVVCSNALHKALNERNLKTTGDILDNARETVVAQFQKGDSEMNDGMDVCFVRLNRAENTIQFSGANNPLYLVRDGELQVIKGDKQPVGKFIDPKPFQSVDMEVKEGDCYYLFTDGFADQFGGENGKKFKYKSFQQLLQANSKLPMSEQRSKLDHAFKAWIGDFEQVDDVCVIGFRI